MLAALLLVLAAIAQAPAASAAAPAWTQRGPFEACLENALEAWVGAKAALVANQDPAASGIDDAGVAGWTVATVEQCRAQGAAADATSVERFEKHMAQWRQHIYDLAASIRRKAQPD